MTLNPKSIMPAPETTLMFQEAAESSQAVARFLTRNADVLTRIAAHLRQTPPKSVTTCARGSSDHAATYGKYMIETYLGIPTSSAALSVSSIYEAGVRGNDSLCIAISQSGRSPDLLKAVADFKAAGAYVIALVNDETAPLVDLANEVLPLCAGPELSVAATKSYISALAALAALVAHWSGDAVLLEGLSGLPTQLDAAFALDWSPALADLKAASSLFVIGRGYGLAIAQEAALKLKETCALHAEAFSAAEVKHGPMAIVGDGFPVIAFATSDTAGDGVRDVAAEFASRDAKVWLADAASPHSALPAIKTDPALEPLLMIASFYRLANSLSLARGLNPDQPPHLNKVTRTT